ncbi:MAG: S8 family serine peptidase, partial [Muribaculaceae bacterium]|nr:S8 family serine peptidase [Muribaculaceae bacterium]
GKLTAYTTPTQIKNFTTENSGETHGTHVLGIMGGGYDGPAKYAVIGGVNGRQAVLTEQDAADSAIPFYGVATDADLAIGCGTLTDGNISAGVQKIVEYAEANGQPCVVNLSVGSTMGPHDGTDAITKYLAQLGERAIICIAAGNDGEDNISISAKGKNVQTFVEATTSSGSGNIQFWGSDNQPFTIRFIAYDRSKGKEVFSYTLDKNLEGKSVRQSDMTGFSSALKGTITLSSNVNTANNRYNVSASVSVSGISSTVFPGFVIEPLEDQTVDGFANNMVFLSNSVPGFTNGNANNSISSMACGENVIVVGSFTTAAQWAAFDTKGGATIYSYNPRPTVGAISAFSSYGKTFGGKQLPDICAPGEGIISSFSQHYVNKAPASAT